MIEFRTKGAPEEGTETEATPRVPACRSPRSTDEALATLVALAQRRAGSIPTDLLARHALAVGSGGDYRAASEPGDAAVAVTARQGVATARDEATIRIEELGPGAVPGSAGVPDPFVVFLPVAVGVAAGCGRRPPAIASWTS